MIDLFKAEFQDARGIHFNNAGMAPISKRVASRIATATTENQIYGSMTSDAWLLQMRRARERIANFFGADLAEFSLSQNCGSALSQAAFGFPLKAGDRVVTLDQEYASNFYPWKEACARSGAELVVVKSEANLGVSTEKLLAAITPGVKLVGVSWVEFQTGSVLDLRSIGEHCHKMGAYLVVDAIQGLGQLPFSFRDLPVDFVVGASHKWLCALTGQGFFAVKPEFGALLKPIQVGAGTFNRIGANFDEASTMEKSARRFESGGLSFLSLFALDSAVELQMEVGIAEIAKEISRLSKKLREGLLEQKVDLVTPFPQAGGITSFKLPLSQESKFLQRCNEEEISLVKRGDFVRISLHAFCQDEHVQKVLDLLRSVR